MENTNAASDNAKVNGMIDLILELLPNSPQDKPNFWSDGSEIMAKTAEQAKVIADFLEALGCGPLNTGFYDPEEDARNDEVDEFTGYHYITV